METTAGEKLVQPGGGFMLEKPIYREVTSESGKQIQITARTIREAVAMLKGVTPKFPKVDPAAEIKRASSSYNYPEGAVRCSPDLWRSLRRSVVKTVVAFAHYLGISSERCDAAFAYLRDGAVPPCFGYFYESDLVAGRPAGVPIHAVAISGNPKTGLLLGYLEYFGVHRVVVRLSRSYSGSTLERPYGLNPLTGQPVPVRVTLPFSLDDIRAIYDYRKIPEGAVARAFSEVVPSALERRFEREK